MPGEVYDSKRLFAIARKEVLFHVRVVGEVWGLLTGRASLPVLRAR
jgi:hypothetical protein